MDGASERSWWRPRSTGLSVPPDPTLPFVELRNYRFHVRTYGDPGLPPLIIVHGGPGGDSHHLNALRESANRCYVVLYDQRGTGLSPRVDKEALTLDSSLDDLHDIVSRYADHGPVRLLGHSWGAMLVVAYLGRHPDQVSHARYARTSFFGLRPM